MRINNNIMALNTHRQYNIANNGISQSAEKLASGYRINRAGDDAAGLAISEKMRAQIRGLNMASKNSQDAVSMVQTAEGALQETHNILQRMRELAVQSASDTNETTIDRGALQLEFQELQSEIDEIANKTKFNDQSLIASNVSMTIQTGANEGDYMTISISAMNTTTLGVSTAGASAASIGTRLAASAAITSVNNAVNAVSTQRAKLGAYQNRLGHKIANLDTSAENLQASESRIRDIDMAKEMTNFTKQNILVQASTAMLSQANSAPQNVLSLLR